MTKPVMKALPAFLIPMLILVSLNLSVCENIVGIGASPSEIFVAQALRGGEYQKAIKIFNSMENATKFTLNATGDISGWVTFYINENLTSPVTQVIVAAKSDKTVLAVFKIPEYASNGNYSGSIHVQTLPAEVSGQASTSVILSASIRVLVEVIGTQILTGEVQDISTIDTEVGYPLRIKVHFINTGNVIANPEIKTIIFKDGTAIDSFTYSKTSVKPGLKETISIEWNTTGREPGEYTANITVSLGGNILAQKTLQFKLLPIGALTRQGELTSLSYNGKPIVGIVLKIHATFKNTGLIDTQARFVGEVYRDDNLIEVIESLTLLIEVGLEKNLTAYFKPTEKGLYTIKGRVIYDGKQTEGKELKIQVEEAGNPNNPERYLSWLAVIISIMLIVTIYIAIRKPRKLKKRHLPA